MAAAVVLMSLAAAPHRVEVREVRTVEAAGEVVRSFAALPLRGIPRGLLHDAAGVAVVPHVVKAGLVVGGRFGRGVVLVHERDGCWSNPVFVTLQGNSIGGQIGVESTDLVLVFKTRPSLERALSGKLTLGADVTVAAGPVGREAEAASPRLLRADVFSYSRSRGLFAGVALDGARLHIDDGANDGFYGLHHCRPEHVLARKGVTHAAVVALKEQLTMLSVPVAPPAVLLPPGRR
jgi:lipid-binding SYLF domain-containing protein